MKSFESALDTPVVFLDIDGVLNSYDFLRKQPLTGSQDYLDLDPSSIQCLNKITNQTGAVIVLSSTWRLSPNFWDLIARLGPVSHGTDNQGITARIVGRTPRLPYPGLCRGDEIRAWLDCQIFIPPFVILDDDGDMGDLIDHLVRTDPMIGLCKPDVEKAVSILTR